MQTFGPQSRRGPGRRWCALAVLAVAAVTGCGDDDQRTVTGDEPGPEELVSCGVTGPPFPRAALDSVGSAPAPDPEMTEAMDSFLDTGEGDFWPQDGWRVLFANGSRAIVFAHDEPQLWFQTLERTDGSWRWAGSSSGEGCPLRVPTPDGYNAVEWRLDPDGEPAGPTSTEIDVLVSETACASGEPVGDRLVGPEIEVTEAQVQVGFLAEAQPGAHTCPGNPETPVVIELEEPLGERELIDAYLLGTDLLDHLDTTE